MAHGHRTISRFALPELISAPYPAYVSMQSALFHHGSSNRSRRSSTPRLWRARDGSTRRWESFPFIACHPNCLPGFEVERRWRKDRDVRKSTVRRALPRARHAVACSRACRSSNFPANFRWPQLRDFAKAVKSPIEEHSLNDESTKSIVPANATSRATRHAHGGRRRHSVCQQGAVRQGAVPARRGLRVAGDGARRARGAAVRLVRDARQRTGPERSPRAASRRRCGPARFSRRSSPASPATTSARWWISGR